jgi:arabinofuranosyltransferase
MKQAILVALLLLAAGALVAHSLVFNFVTDDAFISFVYSRHLAFDGQLVFNLGERVEGYTNFLWTVLMAALLKVGLLPEITSRVLGTAFGVATLGTTAWLSRRERWSPWDAVPALFLAGVPGYACWSSGGLETQMFVFFVTLGAALHLKERPLGAALAFGVAALTRPEGILFFALTGLHHLMVRRRFGRDELRALGAFAILVVPHLLWRRWYYGWWLPNTFYIKSSGGHGTWEQGGYYLLRFVENFHLWAFAVAALGLVAARESRRLGGYVLIVLPVFFLYVASVGGDFMGLYRFALPVVPLLLVAASAGLRALTACAPAALQASLIGLLLAGHAWHARAVTRHAVDFIGADRGIDSPGYLRWYTADRAAIGKWFARHARPDDFAAVGGAGAQVYYSGIASLDCFGLSDAYIAHKVPAGSSRPGHQKYAPDDYILSRKPTIVTSHNYNIGGAPKACSDTGSWKLRGYRCVSARVPGLSSPYYSFLLRNDRQMSDLVDESLPPTGDREP